MYEPAGYDDVVWLVDNGRNQETSILHVLMMARLDEMGGPMDGVKRGAIPFLIVVSKRGTHLN